MKKQSVFTGIAGVAAILLLISLLAMGRVLGERPTVALAGKRVQPLAAKFISKQAPLMASFLVNPDRLSLFTQLSTPPAQRKSLRQEWQQVHNHIQRTWLIDYDRFVRPWLGDELTLAVTTPDLDRQPANGFQPGYLWAMSMANEAKAQRSLEKLWQELAAKGANLIFEQHQGIAIITAEGSGMRPTLAGTVLGNFALFGNDVQVIRNAINDLQVSDLSLAHFPRYRESVDRLNRKRIGYAFINLSELGNWGSKAAFLSSDFADLPVASLSLGLEIAEGGIRAETLLVSDQPLLSPSSGTKLTNSLTPFLPDNATIFAGHDLETTWLQLQESLAPYPSLGKAVTSALAHLETTMGLNIKQDIFSWVRGDYTLAILPGTHPTWLFLAEKTDTNTTDALSHLDALAHDQQQLTVGKVTIGKQELTVWTTLEAKDPTKVTGAVQAVHSETPKFIGFASSVPDLAAVLSTPKKSSAFPKQDFAYVNRKVPFGWMTNLLGIPDQGVGDWLTPILPHFQSVTIARIPDKAGEILRGQISLTLQ